MVGLLAMFSFGFSVAVLLKKVGKFALISGAGLALDVTLYSFLLMASLRPGYANLISAATAVTFVYVTSTRRVFEYKGRFLVPLFIVYATYQVAAVAAASWAVDTIVRMGATPIFAKIVILPITFSANYVFMHTLTSGSLSRQTAKR